MTLNEFGALLAGVYPKTYHYTTSKQKGNYVVWQEYAARRQTGGPLLVRHIQVDLYTRNELDPVVDKLMVALEGAGVYHEEPEVTYDPDTGYIRHLVECEIVDTTTRRMTNGK